MNLVIVWSMWFSIDYRLSFIINTDIEFAPHILGNYFMPLNLMVHRHHLSHNNYTIHTSIHTCHYRDTHTDTCNIRRSRVATTTSRCCRRTQRKSGSNISTCHSRSGRADHDRGGRRAGCDRGRGGFWLRLGLCKCAIEQVV